MSEVSIGQQIFQKFFQNLREKYDIDEEIVNRIKKLYEENKLSDPAQLDKFVQWLVEYNVKD